MSDVSICSANLEASSNTESINESCESDGDETFDKIFSPKNLPQ